MIQFGITGHTGSLGRILIKSNKDIRYSLFKGDIRKKKDIDKWFLNNRFDAIIHLAAIVPIKEVNKNRVKAREINYLGTKNVVDACLKKKIRWFFFSSTSHVYSSSKKKILEKAQIKPISYYGKTKSLAENYIVKKFKNTKIPYCIGRIFSTTNKNQKKNYLIPDLKNRIYKSKKKIILKNLNHYRDFISMEDISKIIFILFKKKFSGVINIGSGNAIFLKDIASTIGREYNKNLKFIDNNKRTYLVANINKLKKFYKLKLSKSIKKLIF